jgi:DNA-binding NarL/FixJ family response regulator
MNGHRVVCVDDNEDYRLLVRLAFDGVADFELVGEARCAAAEAVPVVEAARPDVVLLDVSGGTNGLGLVPRLRDACPGARVMVLTGFDAAELRDSLRSAGAVGQIARRVPPTKLADEIRTLGAMLEMIEGAVDRRDTTLEADPSSSRHARRFIDEALRRWDCGDLADTVTLLISELVANAVMHAHSTAEISVLLHPGCVRIEVADRDPTIPKRRNVGLESTSGRGLALVEALSRSWGIERTPTGKYIWFEVDRPDASHEPPEGTAASE